MGLGLGGPKILAPLSCALTIGALLDTSKYKKVSDESCSEPLAMHREIECVAPEFPGSALDVYFHCTTGTVTRCDDHIASVCPPLGMFPGEDLTGAAGS